MSRSHAPGDHSSTPPPHQASLHPFTGPPNRGQPDVHGQTRPIEQPPFTTAAGERSRDVRGSPSTTHSTPARALGVQSILNPSLESTPLSATDTTSLPRLPPPTTSPRGRKRPEPASPTKDPVQLASLPGTRRVLTPKSPGMRTASLGPQRLPSIQTTSGISGPTLTGPEPRIYTAEPGSANVPTLPPLTAAHRAYAPLQPIEAPPYSGPGPAHVVQPIAAPQSQEVGLSGRSPHPPHQTSPPFQYGSASASQTLPRAYRSQTNPAGYGPESVPRGPSDAYQSTQASYQMTLETDQGPMVVPVELDLLQASKVADEKRKRNAGASARFRARRKEKEKEASHTIASLQQDLRELRKERDFYRQERDFMRDFAARHVGLAQLPPRPASPIQRLNPMSGLPEADEPTDNDEGARPRSDSAPAAQRRRTGDYHLPFSPPQPEPGQGYASGYPQQPGLPLPPPQAPGPYASPRSLPPGPPAPPGPPPLGPRSQSSYDPFRRDQFDRGWDPSR